MLSRRPIDHLSSPSNVELTFSPPRARTHAFLEADAATNTPAAAKDPRASDIEDRPLLRIASPGASPGASGPAERLRAVRTLVRSCADFRLRGGGAPADLGPAHDLKRARWYAINCLMRMQERAVNALGGC